MGRYFRQFSSRRWKISATVSTLDTEGTHRLYWASLLLTDKTSGLSFQRLYGPMVRRSLATLATSPNQEDFPPLSILSMDVQTPLTGWPWRSISKVDLRVAGRGSTLVKLVPDACYAQHHSPLLSWLLAVRIGFLPLKRRQLSFLARLII
jgi:hypothetical protein